MSDDLILEVNNVGPISKANINIGKINVVGGINSTGKSTASKLLYCFLRANSPNSDELIINNCVELIMGIHRRVRFDLDQEDLEEFRKIPFPISRYRRGLVAIGIEEIVDYTYFLNDVISKMEASDRKNFPYEHMLNELNYIVSEVLNDSYRLYTSKLKEVLLSEFNDQMSFNVSSHIKPEAILKSEEFDFEDKFDFYEYSNNLNYRKNSLSGNRSEDYPESYLRRKRFKQIKQNLDDEKFIFHKNSYPIEQIFYLDSFSIFDNESNGLFYSEHVETLKKKLHNTYQYKAGRNVDLDLQIDILLNDISKLIGGEIIQNRSEIEFVSKDNVTSPMKTTASGIKQIGIIQKLLTNRSLVPNSFLIIDEPEVNLHPEWQVKFAEILVLIASELNVSLYINTHSPMFIEAITLYSEFYDLLDETNVYLTEEEFFVQEKESGSPERRKVYLVDETDTAWVFREGFTFKKIDPKDMGAVYENLSRPYDDLDDIKSKLIFKETKKSKKH